MVSLFIRNIVANYDIWKQRFDRAREMQQTSGILESSVHRAVDDPNVVIVVHKFQDADSARAFINLPALKEAMQEAGVEGESTFWLAEDVA